jgi:hypothetical protein
VGGDAGIYIYYRDEIFPFISIANHCHGSLVRPAEICSGHRQLEACKPLALVNSGHGAAAGSTSEAIFGQKEIWIATWISYNKLTEA